MHFRRYNGLSSKHCFANAKCNHSYAILKYCKYLSVDCMFKLSCIWTCVIISQTWNSQLNLGFDLPSLAKWPIFSIVCITALHTHKCILYWTLSRSHLDIAKRRPIKGLWKTKPKICICFHFLAESYQSLTLCVVVTAKARFNGPFTSYTMPCLPCSSLLLSLQLNCKAY